MIGAITRVRAGKARLHPQTVVHSTMGRSHETRATNVGGLKAVQGGKSGVVHAPRGVAEGRKGQQ